MKPPKIMSQRVSFTRKTKFSKMFNLKSSTLAMKNDHEKLKLHKAEH